MAWALTACGGAEGGADAGDAAALDAGADDAAGTDSGLLDAATGDGGCAREGACACGDGRCGDGVVCVDARLCAPPRDLAAEPGDGRALLMWMSVGLPATTVVLRAQAPGGAFEEVGTTSGTSFLDAPLTNGATYVYVVRTRSDVGESRDSVSVSVTPEAPPAPPSGLAAEPGDGAVTLRWTPGAGAARTYLRRTLLTSGAAVDLGSVDGATYADTGLANGVLYAYAAQSENSVGTSAWTADVEAMPIAVPTHVVAVAGDGQVALFWSPSVGAVSYEVESAASAFGPFSFLMATSATGLVDAPLPNGVARAYRVIAVSAVGRGGPSAVVEATPSADASPVPPPEDPTQNRVGLNVWFNTDWDGTRAFTDVFKSSRPWQDGADWHLPVGGTDALGWPTADASTVLFSGDRRDFNGTYRLDFEGQATVSMLWCPGSVTGVSYDPATNTTRADVTFRMDVNGSVGLAFRNTRRTASSALGTGFANARLFRPGYPEDGSVRYTAPFLAALGRVRVVRMMEWVGGSSNGVVRWEDRVTPEHATQGGLAAPDYSAPDGTVFTSNLGVALEHQIELCNVLHADCWINVPPVADDEFVRNMALALRFGTDGTLPYTSPQAAPRYPPLVPTLRLYLEYGNENWNSGAGFQSIHMIRAIAGHLAPGHPLLTPTPDSIWTVVWRYPAWRTAVIGEAFRAVFGDAAMMSRVRPVLMTQAGNAQNTLGAALTWLEPYAASLPGSPGVRDLIYAAGGSGYYGVNSAVSALPDAFFAAANYPDAYAVHAFGIDSLWAANVGVRHVAYEGGPGLSFSAGDNRALNADVRMTTLMTETHDAWTGAGGDLLVYYTLRGPSEWEFTPNTDLATTPKLLALDTLQARPRSGVTLGGGLPGALVARGLSALTIRSGYGYDYTIDGLPCAAGFSLSNFVALPGHAAGAYSGSLVVRGYAATTTRLAVWINGARIGEVALPGRTGTAHLDDSTPLPVSVPEGLVAVRLEALDGGFTLYSVTL